MSLEADDPYSLTANSNFLLTPPVTTASYKVLVTDQSGHATSLTTAPFGPLSFAAPASPAEGAVITDTTPTFSWGSTYATPTALGLLEEGSPSSIWGHDSTTDSQVVYNSDGTATESALQPGHSYLWTLNGIVQPDLHTPRLRVYKQRTSTSLFTEYEDHPAGPALCGKLAYSYAVEPSWSGPWYIQGYNADPHARTWYGPGEATAQSSYDTVGATVPAWSPDGTKLMYLVNFQIWIDPLDGTPPTVLPLPAHFPAPQIPGLQVVAGRHADRLYAGGL